jgi:hypothetical protein
MSWSAWTMAALSALCVLAPSLKWVSKAGGAVNMYGAFVPSDGVAIFAPRLVGAMVAVPAAVLVTKGARSRRLGFWTVAALALLGQMVMALEWLSAGHRLASGAGFVSVQIGWYVDLVVVALGSVAIAAGGYVVVLAVWGCQSETSRPRTRASVASVALGAVVIWLLSRDLVFIARWPWEAFVPPLPAMALAAAWTVVVVGVAGPALSVTAARKREVAVGVVCGWWAFLAVPCTEAIATRLKLGPQWAPGAFWAGTALAVIGGFALITWTRPAGPRERRQPAHGSNALPEEWPARTDEDPLRR